MKIFTFCFFILFFPFDSISQGVAINTTGDPAHVSSMLDISSSSKGILIPRLSTLQRNAIISPAIGLTIFNIDCLNFNYFNGNTWVSFPNGSGIVPAMPTNIFGPVNFCNGQTNINYYINSVNGATSYNWTIPINAVITSSSDTSILVSFGSTPGNICVSASGACGTSSLNCISVILDTSPVITSQSNNMTICTGTNASFSVNVTGSGLIYQWQEFTGSWININTSGIYSGINTNVLNITNAPLSLNNKQYRCQISTTCGVILSNPSTLFVNDIPNSPTQGTHTSTQTQITWNWNSVTGATGYKWNTVNDFSSAIDMSNSLTKTETGLLCGTTYTRYIWAYNFCGSSLVSTLTQNTTACTFTCGNNFNITHVAGDVAPVTKNVTYGTVVVNISGTNKCMITQNLGADNQASAVNDASEPSAGWYWQYNRKQGYKNDGITTTPSWNNTIVTGGSWSSFNDPCALLLGNGWRLPTDMEWGYIDSWMNATEAFASPLKLHEAGLLDYASNGALLGRGSNGLFWSSDQWNIANGYDFLISNTDAVNDLMNKGFGLSVRCIKD